jgi:hypothetical protein
MASLPVDPRPGAGLPAAKIRAHLHTLSDTNFGPIERNSLDFWRLHARSSE